MSRYSRIFLRPKDSTLSSESWAGESSTKMSTAEPRSTTSAGFSYPTSSSLPSHELDFSMASPPPHPYTLGATHSPVEVSFRQAPTTSGHGQLNTSEISTEKPPENVEGYQYPPPRPSRRTRTPSIRPPPIPLRQRPVVLFLLFLPIPPLLSLIYMVVGHAILRGSQSSPNSIYLSPLLSSVEAGATGGVILSLPLALLLYLLLFPNKPSAAPEDFFEDDTSSIVGQEKWLLYAGYTVCAFLLLCIGGIAGPLGVTCLSNGTLAMFVGNKRMLSASAAAAAGFVGGAIVAFGTLAISVLVTVGWTFWMRQQKPPS
ncbi:hypothetical protein BDZ97DRAFT_591177 [Flammula alnicola]|nr:hypothetical protein BDZ97DRAFT_591177 [Flammula alnicola]